MDTTAAQERMIWSADVEDPETLRRRLEDEPRIIWVKVDRYFIAKYGRDVIDMLNHMGKKVFDDEKIIEIPTKVELLARLHAEHRPAMLNCMAGCVSNGNYDDFIAETPESKDARDGLKRFADVCHRYGVAPCGVTVLTSKSREIGIAEFGRLGDQVLYYIDQLRAAGFTDIVCSPLEVEKIRDIAEFNGLKLNTPGIRLAGTDFRDQQRVGQPYDTIKAGADRLVIGSNLTDDLSGENCTRILDEIMAAA